MTPRSCKTGKVSLKKDKIQDEIKRRIEAIDKGEEVLIPYSQCMDEMLSQLQSKYTDNPQNQTI